MKRSLIVLSLFVSGSVFSQNILEGTWEGKLNVGVEVRMVFHIKKEANGYSATADSPDQSAFDLPVESVEFDSDSLVLNMPALMARYEGRLVNDTLIRGQLVQGGTFPVDLKKVKAVSQKIRPQMPKAPFPYKEEKVSYQNADQSIRFGATLLLPGGKGPFPAVVLISGSGAQDRNSTVLEHPVFLVLADHLARNGVAVLRYDERGVGESTGVFAGSTSADFAADVHAALNYLITRKEIDPGKLGLIGHSEGGMIAPMVATERKDISFLVLLAAPGVPHIEMMALQNETIARTSGMPDHGASLVPVLFRGMVSVIRDAKDVDEAKKKASEFLDKWIGDKDPAALAMLNLNDAGSRSEYVAAMSEQLKMPWFDYFIRFDPTVNLKKLKGKVLALNGTKDVQVIHSQNLPGIEAALKKSRVKVMTVREMEGLNHLFQTCKTCTLQEYGVLDETFSPAALQMISGWIGEHIK